MQVPHAMTAQRTIQRTYSNLSIASVDSAYSLDSTSSMGSVSSLGSACTQQSLPTLYCTPSASRNLQLKSDIQSIRQQIETNCRKTARRKKKKKGLDKLIVYYNDWERWLRKHRKGTIVGGLSEGEFKTLYGWFTARMKNNPDGVRGIKVANVVDDFMESGLYEDRADAYSFICKIDTERNGDVSFDSFMAAFQDTTDVAQLHFLKQFVKVITPTTAANKSRHHSRAHTSHGGSRGMRASRRAETPSMRSGTLPPPSSSQRPRSKMSTTSALKKDTSFPLLPSPIQKKKSLKGHEEFYY